MSRRKVGALPAVVKHEWDKTLAVGDLVTIIKDIPHLYLIKEVEERSLAPHDFYNHPTIATSGLSSGSEVAPLLLIQCVREAPSYFLLPVGRTYVYKIDAYKVVKVTSEDVQAVIDNLTQVKLEVQRKM